MTFAEEVWQHRQMLLKVARYNEDFVQETMLRAIKNEKSFNPGTNLAAWLCTILRHYRNDQNKKYRREVYGLDYDPRFVNPVGTTQLEAREVIESITGTNSDALLMVHVMGYSYIEAAEALDVKVGTIKSRVCRATQQLEQAL